MCDETPEDWTLTNCARSCAAKTGGDSGDSGDSGSTDMDLTAHEESGTGSEAETGSGEDSASAAEAVFISIFEDDPSD